MKDLLHTRGLSSTGSGTSGSGSRRHEKDTGAGNHLSASGGGGSSSASSTVSSLVVVGPNGGSEEILVGDSLPHASGYRELMQLIKLQREKINTQQADLSKVRSPASPLEPVRFVNFLQDVRVSPFLLRSCGIGVLDYTYVPVT
uniref:Uncharacterized protein n=1 Tax=Anopheles melas TaxID=34690 RepID=A0A182UHF1_9DIPT